MLLKYKKNDFEIYIKNQKYEYDINKDIDMASIREQFNKSIGYLSKKHNSLEYWLMRLSERNTLHHHLFFDICRIYLVKSLMKQHKNIEIHTDNLLIYLYYFRGSKISFRDLVRFKIKKILVEKKPYLPLIKFLVKKFLFNLKYKNKSRVKAIKDTTIIQTWVSDGNFKDDSFKDSYYGDLAEYLRENGKKVITWPIFYNVKNQAKSVKFIRKYNDSFILLEDYLKPIDYVEAIKHFIKKRFLNLGKVTIGDDDFTNIFKYYQKKESIEMVSLFYSFTKRLKDNGSKNITFLQHHENMIPEKALILGVQKYLQDSRVIGYFHTTKPKNLLCLEYATIEELQIAPKPHRVVFNSFKYQQYFEKKFPQMSCKSGIAFKQLYLKSKSQKKDKDTDKVLVLFSGTNDEVQLVFDLLNSLENEYNFILRMHPMNRFNVNNHYKKDNYEIENETALDSLIFKVSKVISSYSAVALELALMGADVGLLYDKKKLLLNPFDDTDVENYQLISSTQTLEAFLSKDIYHTSVEQIFNLEQKEYKTFLE